MGNCPQLAEDLIIFLPASMLPSTLDGWSMPWVSWRDVPMEMPKLNRRHYIPGKLPSLLKKRIPAYLMQKKPVGVSKNIPLLTEGIIRRM